MIEFIVGFFGPLGIILIAQYLSQKELQKKGVPESLEQAMIFFRDKILLSHLHLSPPTLLNRDEVELKQLVGLDLTHNMREDNKNKLKYYYLFEKDNRFLPILFRSSPVLVLILLYALLHFLTDPNLVDVNANLGMIRWIAISLIYLLVIFSVGFIIYTYKFAVSLIENSN